MVERDRVGREKEREVKPDWLGLQQMPWGAPPSPAPITHIIIFTY